MKKEYYKNIKELRRDIFCDVCKKKIKGNIPESQSSQGDYFVCGICERDVCHECFGKPREIKGLYLMPCPICRKIKTYPVQIKRAWIDSDYYRDKAFQLQKRWSKISKEKGEEYE